MPSKKTDELLKILEKETHFDDYIAENAGEFISASLSELLAEYESKCGLEKADIIRNANLDKTYAYQMFSGAKKNPSRDKVLMLCFGMGLSVTDTQTLLKRAGYPQLYPRIKRDSALIFSLERKLSVMEANELLFDLKEPILE